MKILTPEWPEYELLDSGNGRRLERFGEYILDRPDPQAIWQSKLPVGQWSRADAVFTISSQRKETGFWKTRSTMPAKWQLKYHAIPFWVKLASNKHTGIFPEQAVNWEWIEEKIRNQKSKIKDKGLNVLNLFGYTGAASLVCAAAGAKVTHVDASRPAIAWARENQATALLTDRPIRWILDDTVKFLRREVKRNIKYDGIIMDPPVYGHGPNGEVWDFMKDLPELLNLCRKVLSEKALFIIINAYAVSASAIMLENMLSDLNLGGRIEAGELALKESNGERLLSTGIFARWQYTI